VFVFELGQGQVLPVSVLISESDVKEISSITSIVMTDSGGYVHITPLRSKNQWNLMVQELLMFARVLGHAELTFRCDNEPLFCSFKDML
jgi:hypothetical protein